MGRWKGVRHGIDGPLELYDLDGDPGERSSVADAQPDIVRRMEAYLLNCRTESPEYPSKRAKTSGT
jgi:hypothetical protein